MMGGRVYDKPPNGCGTPVPLLPRAFVENRVNRLVGETETTLMFAIDAWADTAAQTNSVGAAMGEKQVDKNKDKDAKGKAEGLRGAAQPELAA
jgi:hypothetical protein